MKKLEELGISPAPWNTVGDEGSLDVVDSSGEEITVDWYQFTRQDARLVAAAPELYKWLAYAIEQIKCETRSCNNCPNGKCWVVDAAAALAKAAGEEAK